MDTKEHHKSVTIRQTKLMCCFTLVVLLIACTVTKSIQRRNAPISGDFGYEIWETTGADEFMRVNNEEVQIIFDEQHSDKESLKLLHSLKRNVWYLNRDGKEITLKGIYNPQSGKFILRAWSIIVPFRRATFIDESVMPTKIKSVTCLGLRSSDFEHR